MLVAPYNQAKHYDAPNHRNVIGLHLLGLDDRAGDRHLVACSYYLPGGGAGPDASPFEKIYVVLNGEMIVKVNGVETRLGPLDSCVIAADETRELINPTLGITTLLVVLLNLPTAPKEDGQSPMAAVAAGKAQPSDA